MLALAIAIVASQPVGSTWWAYADADATYAGSSLNLLFGAPVRYLDHPGLPLEEVLAGAFGVDYAIRHVTGGAQAGSRQAYVDHAMLHLDSVKAIWRGFGIAFYLTGALLSFVLAARLFGHWKWGLAAGLLWAAEPGLAAMSIQFRPDVPLAVLCVVFAYLVGRGVERRSAGAYLGAAFVVGLAMMVKVHGAGLAVPLALAVVLRPPPDGWAADLRTRANAFVQRHRVLLAVVALAWIVLWYLSNKPRIPFTLEPNDTTVVLVPLLVTGAFLAAAVGAARLPIGGLAASLRGRVLNPFYAAVAAMTFIGLALPVTLEVPDGLRALVHIQVALQGKGIIGGVPHGSLVVFESFPLKQAGLVFLLAAIGAVVGAIERDPQPVVWFVGACVLGWMAYSRRGTLHYWAPFFALSVPSALWLFRRLPRRASLLVWPVVAYVVLPQIQHRQDPAHAVARAEALSSHARRFLDAHLTPRDIAIADNSWPDADTRYWALVQLYVDHTPLYPYREIPSTTGGPEEAAARGLRFRYYVGPEAALVTSERQLSLPFGRYTVRPIPGQRYVVALLHGPGADRPFTP